MEGAREPNFVHPSQAWLPTMQPSSELRLMIRDMQELKRNIDVLRYHDLPEIKEKLNRMEETQKTIFQQQGTILFGLYNMNAWEAMAKHYLETNIALTRAIHDMITEDKRNELVASAPVMLSTPPAPVQYQHKVSDSSFPTYTEGSH